MKKDSSRRVGLIRQAVLPDTAMPHAMKDLSINNINLYSEMKQLNSHRDNVFTKYQEIIHDLETVIKNMENKNMFLNQQRLRLLSENLKLRQQLDNFKENFIMADSYVKKQTALFDIVPDQDTINYVLPNIHKKTNQILQQSEFDLDIGRAGHYFSQQVSANISMSDTVKSQQKTPCLNHHHSLIQCKSNNNQAPLRIFYLLLLQEPAFIKKIRQLLDFCVQDDSKILLHLLPGHNNMWAEILNKFLDLVVKGEFQNENQVIQYISQNCLIDMLFVSLLKQYLPVENEDQNLNIGDWKHEQINHRALFQGLCNEFDLLLEEDRQSSIFKFYANCEVQKSLAQQFSQQNLLQSRTQQRQDSPSINPVEISLFTKPKGQYNSNSQSRQQPIFKIWFDEGRKYFRTNVSIRPQKFVGIQDEYEQADSFRMTQKSVNQQGIQNSRFQEQQPVPLMMRDMNKQYPERIGQKLLYRQQQYLRPNYESRDISGNNSYACSQAGFS